MDPRKNVARKRKAARKMVAYRYRMEVIRHHLRACAAMAGLLMQVTADRMKSLGDGAAQAAASVDQLNATLQTPSNA